MGGLLQMNSIRIVPRSPSVPLTPPPTSQFTEEVNAQDAWLPITASRNGNTYYSVFQLLNSGIGIQALSLPVAFTVLGWSWGIIWLSMGFIWQLYTTWLLVQLHESVPGTRYSRYLHLSTAAFGEKLGKLLALIPVLYLSAGTCVMLVITAGGSMKLFLQIVCESNCNSKPLTAIEWYLVFVILAIIIAQFHPNLNSVVGISVIGAITALTYCTLIWVFSITETRPANVSYNPVKTTSNADGAFTTFTALGIIALVFRGHNVMLEIQGTMPSSEEHPSRMPMWRAVKFAYILIAFCLFPLGIGVYWGYGDQIQHANGGMLRTLYKIHGHSHTEKIVLGLASLLTVIASLCSFQIYAMPLFDNLESAYVTRKNGPCPQWVRSGLRCFFGSIVFLVAVTFPFIVSLAGLIGGIALPLTFAYPCFMWVLIRKPKQYGCMWWFNWALGSLGMVISALVFAGGIRGLVNPGINIRFFKP